MGNCFTLHKRKRKIWARLAVARHAKVLRVVKTDGKVLEYKRPMLVKDVMLNFSGYGVGLSYEASRHLPRNCELKIGNVYYLIPLSSPVRPLEPAAASTSSVTSDCMGGVKRIKLVITKQQLDELLSKQISAEEMILGLHKEAWVGVDYLTRWRPMLKTIPEESGKKVRRLCGIWGSLEGIKDKGANRIRRRNRF